MIAGLFRVVPGRHRAFVRDHREGTLSAGPGGCAPGRAILMCTMLGMALGGWMSGKVFDITGSYHAAFINGIMWNLVTLTIACVLLSRTRGTGGLTPFFEPCAGNVMR